MEEKRLKKLTERPAVIVILGHIDHGKSTLLDYIRKENVVEKEAGGITQHLGAYEVIHKNQENNDKKITFLDTPGHEAFQKMRLCGTEVADIAVLIVSAEDGVKAQTLEGLTCIKESGIPYIIAINKIDKPNADIERTKQSLLENEIYLEGLGGDVPWVPISAKTGKGIPELLDMMLLMVELEELSTDPSRPAEGVVIEAHLDPKKGIAATLLIKQGVLSTGSYVVAEDTYSPVRIMEDFTGSQMQEASASSPVQVIGFNNTPRIGATFITVATKKEAEKLAVTKSGTETAKEAAEEEEETAEEVTVIPIIIKADVAGSLDAIEHELAKIKKERARIKIVRKSIGVISENDAKLASGDSDTIIIGFNVSVDARARGIITRFNITTETFDIIYKLSEWLESTIEKRIPEIEIEEVSGQAKILKIFSKTKDKQVVGGRVEQGEITSGSQIRIIRHDSEIGRGKIIGLQQQKAAVERVTEGGEFGAQIQSKIDIAAADSIECLVMVKK